MGGVLKPPPIAVTFNTSKSRAACAVSVLPFLRMRLFTAILVEAALSFREQ